MFVFHLGLLEWLLPFHPNLNTLEALSTAGVNELIQLKNLTRLSIKINRPRELREVIL